MKGLYTIKAPNATFSLLLLEVRYYRTILRSSYKTGLETKQPEDVIPEKSMKYTVKISQLIKHALLIDDRDKASNINN